ncbi:hypothetical protein A4Z71_05065 [Candidatus Rhodoluna planktonica]|uniref:DAGKc domain-containing protein n=1 Tax=Candidatus Rhodoluna planktonica TaxID=535712 RepID=A0A1D9DZW0_9MICO|nr:hypothetical protein A4Z71_05065 [Candidatus Rhodoluna planktonica]
MRFGLVVNPTAGSGHGRLVADQVLPILARAGELVDLSAENYQSAAVKVRQAIDDGAVDSIVVVGGDGMAHLGANLCADKPVHLGIIPAGTGNDSAETLGIPKDPVAAAEYLISRLSSPRRVDTGYASTSSQSFNFLGTVSAGFDALVNRRANQMRWPKGPSRYQLAMLAELASFKPIRYHAVIDGQEREFDAMLCAVANSGQFGGGMKIAPQASIDDGYLDLFIVHSISRPELIKVFPKVYSGAHVSHPAVEFVRARHIQLQSGDMPAYSDGEYVGNSPITATIRPASLSVLA